MPPQQYSLFDTERTPITQGLSFSAVTVFLTRQPFSLLISLIFVGIIYTLHIFLVR